MFEFAKKSIKRYLRKLGYEVHRVTNQRSSDENNTISVNAIIPYIENPESGPANLQIKQDRVSAGGPFEWPDIVALNQAVAKLLGEDKHVAELGGGTGCFAFEASLDPARHIVCSEYDKAAHEWAKQNRMRPNIRYVNSPIALSEDAFEVVVAIEVIEHIGEYVEFLRACCRLAPRAILTTPNRLRSEYADTAGPPAYEFHVREWSAGEFYWVLRCFWSRVDLYAMPDPYVPSITRVDVKTILTPLIADCYGPLLQ